jgi:hypothetical protein
LIVYRSFENLAFVFAGALYLLLRDATAGRSVGKFLCGLVVINLETGRPCEKRASINRNLLHRSSKASARRMWSGPRKRGGSILSRASTGIPEKRVGCR